MWVEYLAFLFLSTICRASPRVSLFGRSSQLSITAAEGNARSMQTAPQPPAPQPPAPQSTVTQPPAPQSTVPPPAKNEAGSSNVGQPPSVNQTDPLKIVFETSTSSLPPLLGPDNGGLPSGTTTTETKAPVVYYAHFRGSGVIPGVVENGQQVFLSPFGRNPAGLNLTQQSVALETGSIDTATGAVQSGLALQSALALQSPIVAMESAYALPQGTAWMFDRIPGTKLRTPLTAQLVRTQSLIRTPIVLNLPSQLTCQHILNRVQTIGDGSRLYHLACKPRRYVRVTQQQITTEQETTITEPPHTETEPPDTETETSDTETETETSDTETETFKRDREEIENFESEMRDLDLGEDMEAWVPLLESLEEEDRTLQRISPKKLANLAGRINALAAAGKAYKVAKLAVLVPTRLLKFMVKHLLSYDAVVALKDAGIIGK